jgi:hypothetical protein
MMQNETQVPGNLFLEGIDYLDRGLLLEAEESFLRAAASVFSFLGAVAFRRGDYRAALRMGDGGKTEGPE